RAHGQTELTKHNLTPTGPGATRADIPSGVCVFCHTPHNANPTVSLWNRDLSAATYTPYSSGTQVAKPGQPTGSSRLCLSCHDGTTALGNVRKPERTGRFALGRLTGGTVIGTDLSRDHPVSFTYDTALAMARPGLAHPKTLPPEIRLDGQQQLQCTSCHDAHANQHPSFLRMDPRNGALCTACHDDPR